MEFDSELAFIVIATALIIYLVIYLVFRILHPDDKCPKCKHYSLVNKGFYLWDSYENEKIISGLTQLYFCNHCQSKIKSNSDDSWSEASEEEFNQLSKYHICPKCGAETLEEIDNQFQDDGTMITFHFCHSCQEKLKK